MRTSDARALGREAFERRNWTDAFAHLAAADAEAALDAKDLDRLATAAQLIGKDDAALSALTRAHHLSLQAGEAARAARSAYEIAMLLMFVGDVAQANGWLSRGRRVLDESGLDCVERGFLEMPLALQAMFGGDLHAALAIYDRVAEVVARFDDPDLATLCRLGRGEAFIKLGRAAEGIALHDEAMVAVMTGEVSPLLSGIVYCAVIESCEELFDLRRAREWTDALARWCEGQHGLVPFRGQCLVHRAHILQIHGEWPDALAEADRARRWLADPPVPAIGAAWFQLAELHRLRGDFAQAEEAYRQASLSGRDPQPGLALLRLAQGHVDAARSAISREIEEAKDPVSRSKLLPAYVEILVAAGEVARAREAADELQAVAESLGVTMVATLAAQARGGVLLAEGNPSEALPPLRAALADWREIQAPYDAARVRILIGLACRALGDHDGARLELEAARAEFERLGATPELARLAKAEGKDGSPEGLSPRELEVLRLVASGKTNRAIATELVLSEKTVARHVSNIFTKLNVSTRAAATAYAYRHDLA